MNLGTNIIQDSWVFSELRVFFVCVGGPDTAGNEIFSHGLQTRAISTRGSAFS